MVCCGGILWSPLHAGTYAFLLLLLLFLFLFLVLFSTG